MAQAYTRADSLGIYQTISDDNLDGRGGSRFSLELNSVRFVTNTPMPQIVISNISGANGTGDGILSVVDTDTLIWSPPDGLFGAPVAIEPGETVLLEGADPNKWIRVFWDGDYNSEMLGGGDTMTLMLPSGAEDTDRVANSHAAVMLNNHNALGQDITSLKVWIGTLGTQRTTNSAQLSGSGAGTITTTGSLADWPAKGWAHIKTNLGATREIVYYTSRTATSITVPSSGRGLLGTSADAGASTDTFVPVPGIRIDKEVAGSDGRIQVIASPDTAPTGVTWSTANTSATGLTHTKLASQQNLGLWIRTETPAVVLPDIYYPIKIQFEFTVGGATYSTTGQTYYSVRDNTYNTYETYVGEDAAPNFTAAPAASSSTLPITLPLTPPVSGEKTFKVCVRKRNKYDMESQNIFTHDFTIDSNGDLVGGQLTGPQNVSMENIGNGKVRIRGVYPKGLDTNPATRWIGYFTSDGVDPDPAIDTQVDMGAIGEADLLTGRVNFTVDTVSQDWNTTFKMLLRVLRASDNEESTNTDITTIIIDSAAPPHRTVISSAMDQFTSSALELLSTTTISSSPAVKLHSFVGQTVLDIAGTIVFRATVNDGEGARLFVNPLLNFEETTVSGAGTGNIEVVDANTVYLNANSTRRCLIDLSGNVIQAGEFRFTQEVEDNPTTGPVVASTDKLWLSVYNPSRNLWEPFLQLDGAGVLSFAYPVIQMET